MEKKIIESLKIKDLTDKQNGIHAINLIIDKIYEGLKDKGYLPEIQRSNPITTIINNYDRLYIEKDNPSRLPRYTRYIDDKTMLRTHTSSMIPDILSSKKEDYYTILCPGICYRRDVVDKTHCGEPHQMDIWVVKNDKNKLNRKDLIQLIKDIMEIVGISYEYRLIETSHPYTINGLEVEIKTKNGWMELLECGEINPLLLNDANLDINSYSGLALGIGLDRLIMLLKDIDDIRILRSDDSRIKSQMENLDKYVSVSKYPAIRRDLSISVDKNLNEEDICERIQDILEDKSVIEEICIVSETDYKDLPEIAIKRLNISDNQKNILLKIIIRSHNHSLTQEEANDISKKIYMVLDETESGGYISK